MAYCVSDPPNRCIRKLFSQELHKMAFSKQDYRFICNRKERISEFIYLFEFTFSQLLYIFFQSGLATCQIRRNYILKWEFQSQEFKSYNSDWSLVIKLFQT